MANTSFTMPPDLQGWVENTCRQDQITKTDLIVEALEKYRAEHATDPLERKRANIQFNLYRAKRLYAAREAANKALQSPDPAIRRFSQQYLDTFNGN